MAEITKRWIADTIAFAFLGACAALLTRHVGSAGRGSSMPAPFSSAAS